MTVFSVLVVTFTCFAFGAILMAAANVRMPADIARRRWSKLASFFVIVHLVLGSALFGRSCLLALGFGILGFGGWELHRALASLSHEKARARQIAWAVFGLVAFGLMGSITTLPPGVIAYLYMIVAAFDGFSQVFGQLFGRHPLAPLISPNKTVEGLVGGTLGALVFALLIRDLAGLAPGAVIVVGLATAACALAGDLAGSWVKRQTGIKDFSALLAEHGGVLDRFGSFASAAAIVGPLLHTILGNAS